MKLILVEGLPGTGKTTISNWIFEILTDRGKQAELLLEDDERLPSNFAHIAGIPKDALPNLPADAVLARTDHYIYADLRQCAKGYRRWDIGDEYNKHISAEEYARCALEWWQNWARNYAGESICVMDSAFLQNPVNEMIFRGATDAQTEAYIRAVAEALAPLHPVCIYLRRESAEESISFAKAAKGSGWAKGVGSALQKLHCPDLFERRFRLEYSLLSSMDHILCEVNGSDWSAVKKKTLDYLSSE